MSAILDAFDALVMVSDRLAGVAIATAIVGLNINGSEAAEAALKELREIAEDDGDELKRVRNHLWDLIQAQDVPPPR